MNSASTTPSNDAISAEVDRAFVILELAGKAEALTATLGRLIELEAKSAQAATHA
jgi:hypothetical protein